eukprot:scaffold5126_cov125-Isochrysis_galbana.AAC.7
MEHPRPPRHEPTRPPKSYTLFSGTSNATTIAGISPEAHTAQTPLAAAFCTTHDGRACGPRS